MSHHLYTDETPADVKNAKGLHLVTQNTPNGQAVQIMLEELKDEYGTEWTTTVINIQVWIRTYLEQLHRTPIMLTCVRLDQRAEEGLVPAIGPEW